MTITADFSGGEKTATTEPLYQWDTGQKLALSGLPATSTDIQVHFANAAMAQAIVKATATESSLPTCDIPNEFLQFGSAAKARAWVYFKEGSSKGYTIKTVLIPITPRKRPNDYVSPEDPDSQGIVERAMELLENYQSDLDGKLNDADGSVKTANLDSGAVTEAKLAQAVKDMINAKEVKSNKKTTLTGNESSNDFYPTTKAVADAITAKLEAIPYDVKLAMDTLFSKAAYADDDAASSYATFHAWTISNPVTSITTVFTQGSATIYDTDSLDTLKQYLTVTATYSDSTTATVTDYTLSGALEVGTSVITVTYNGKTDSFNVNVTARSVSYIYDGTLSEASWMDNNSIKGVPFSKYTLVAEYSVSGRAMIDAGAAPTPMGGRATSRTQIITRVHDGQTVGLTSYVLSTSATVAYSLWYGYIDANDNTFNGSQCISTDVNYTANSWLSNSVVLPTNARKIGERFLMIGFKKGDGTTEFTATELAELQTLISIT